MKYAWHIFDLIIVVISVIETIAVYVIESYVGAQKPQSGGDATVFLKALKFAKMIKSVRIFRLARLLRFTKTLVPVALTYLNNRLSYKIRSGYNIGQGFVRATEELETSLDLIAGEKGVSKEQMRKVLYKTKASINRDLGLLQRDYPEIAVAVKTKSKASRRVCYSQINNYKITLINLIFSCYSKSHQRNAHQYSTLTRLWNT